MTSTEPTITLPAWAVEFQPVEIDDTVGFIRGPATTLDATGSDGLRPGTFEVRAEQFYDADSAHDVRVTIAMDNGWEQLTPQQARDLAAALVERAAQVEAIR